MIRDAIELLRSEREKHQLAINGIDIAISSLEVLEDMPKIEAILKAELAPTKPTATGTITDLVIGVLKETGEAMNAPQIYDKLIARGAKLHKKRGTAIAQIAGVLLYGVKRKALKRPSLGKYKIA